ncbi:MAG: type II secretion system F family protein [Candidatus Aenigmarchaeota archaeon]|nr:type II secretion system F family protein [Candidatus Aenigmarchaeota archaeon]
MKKNKGIIEALRSQIKEKHSDRVDIIAVGLISAFVGLIIEYINIQLFVNHGEMFALVSLFGILVILVPPLSIKYYRFSITKKLEESFPKFLSDVTSNIKSGMTLPQALRALQYDSYGKLGPYVKEINAKISWGVPFNKVLLNFAKKTESPNLTRTARSIIEAHRSGGTMDTVLQAVSESLYELERIKKERSSSVYSQMLNGYMIFFIFLSVMIGMSRFLLPTFNFGDGNSGFADTLPAIFRNIVLIQGVFAGLTIGKMSEGRIIAGVKHAIVLAVVGFTVVVLAG